MASTLEFDSEGYSERALRLILARAQIWNCTPGEAVARLLDEAARRSLKRIEARHKLNSEAKAS